MAKSSMAIQGLQFREFNLSAGFKKGSDLCSPQRTSQINDF